jgi:V8-like Glu-specific endopeptidase
MKKIALLALATIVSTVPAFAYGSNDKVVYGDDNRVDVFESTNQMFVELSESTAAMIPKGSISSRGASEYSIRGYSLQSRGMCASERFSQQITAANCSGFLVGEDLLVTAGHCITGQSACNSYKWVFDFKVDYSDQFQINVAKSNVYGCKKIISRELNSSNGDDYALIQLDRKVKDRNILNVRKSGAPSVGDNLVVIGHPSGLPTKIADGATVRSLQGAYFTANLDTYGGNSGSAVFNADTGVVEGILVRGATDYVYDSRQGCRVTNVIANDAGRGEDVTFITNIAELQ